MIGFITDEKIGNKANKLEVGDVKINKIKYIEVIIIFFFCYGYILITYILKTGGRNKNAYTP